MLHSDWFSLTVLVSANVSITMMQGDNENIKVTLGITSFTDYLAIYMIYCCSVVFCLYNLMALYNNGESKVVNHLIHGEYELNITSWSKLQKKYNVSRNKIYTALKGKGRPRGSQYRQKKKKLIKPEAIALTLHSKSVKE